MDRSISNPVDGNVSAVRAAVQKWRNAVDLHHLPGGTHSLAPRPGSLVRLAFQSGLPSRSLRAKAGPRGRTCTCNLSVLSGTPLHWATRGACARPPVPTAGFAPTLRAF